jgi:branched-chain amino acid transport system substrate-binding protein
MRPSKAIGLIGGILFSAILLLASSAPAAENEVKIGILAPFSGVLAETGRLNRTGIEFAVDIINGKYPELDLPFAKPGGLPALGGAKIKIIWADTQSDPNVARADVERLIENEGVVAIMGGWSSAEIKTGSQAAERLKTPYVSGAGSSTELTRRGLRYYFRLNPHLGITANSFFHLIDDLNRDYHGGLKTVGIAYENSEYGSIAFQQFSAVAKEKGFPVVAEIPFPKETASVLSEVMKLKSANPDIFINAGYLSDAILLTKTIRDQNFLPKVWFGLSGYDDPTFIQSVGRVANGAMLRGVFDPKLPKKVVQEVNAVYMQRNHGTSMGEAATNDFVTPFVLADAINRAKSLDKEAIRVALESTNIPGDKMIMPWTSIQFTSCAPPPGECHDNKNGRNIILQIQDGKNEIIWPGELQTAKPIFPLAPYDKR